MIECPAWEAAEPDSQLHLIAQGLAEAHRFIAARAKTYILDHGDLKTWHQKTFTSVAPLAYYAGNYRSKNSSRPCLEANVEVGGLPGAPFEQVPGLMQEFSHELRSRITTIDNYISRNPSPGNHARAVVQLAAVCAGKFIRIHPFINGNGRMSRLLTNYLFHRYDYPMPYYAPFPRPSPPYSEVQRECMLGNFDHLFQYLLATLV